MNTQSLRIDTAEDIEVCLDKLLKFAWHLIDELYVSPKNTQFYRWEEYVDMVLWFIFDMWYISPLEEEQIRWNGIEDAIFLILEKLIDSEYFIDWANEIEDCSYAISRIYAIHIYNNLWKVLWKRVLPFNKLSQKEERKLLTCQAKQDPELEQETLEVISILTRGSYLENKDDTTALDDYLNLLWRKWFLTENELINAISTDDIEKTLESVINKKLIAPWKITTQHIVDAFNSFSHAFMKRRQTETKEKIDSILEDNENLDYEVDPLLSHLSTWVTILQNLPDLGWELIDYDVEELIITVTEYDIINEKIAQWLIKKLDNVRNKADIIFEIFEYTFYSWYLDKIDIDKEERKAFKSHYSDVLFALNMLYKD